MWTFNQGWTQASCKTLTRGHLYSHTFAACVSHLRLCEDQVRRSAPDSHGAVFTPGLCYHRLFLTPPRSDPRSWGAECNEPSAGFPALHKAKILNIEEALAFIEVADKLSPSLSCRDSARAVKSQPTVARCSPFHCNYESRLFLMWREHPFTPRPHHSFSYFLSPSACLSLMFPR